MHRDSGYFLTAILSLAVVLGWFTFLMIAA